MNCSKTDNESKATVWLVGSKVELVYKLDNHDIVFQAETIAIEESCLKLLQKETVWQEVKIENETVNSIWEFES